MASRVLVSVPGTNEANDAVLLAQIPNTVIVDRAKAEAEVQVNYDGQPEFKPIESTSLSYASNTQDKVIKVGDLYYLCFQAVWFMSTSPTGPWKTADSVPKEIYTIPTSSPVYNVTYVTQTTTPSGETEASSTAGYLGMFIIGAAVGPRLRTEVATTTRRIIITDPIRIRSIALIPSLTGLALTTTHTTGRTVLLAEHTVHMAALQEPLGITRPPERAGEPSVVAVCMAAQERLARTTRTRALTVQRDRARTLTVNGEARSLPRGTNGPRQDITRIHAVRSRGLVVRRAAEWSVEVGKTEVDLSGRAEAVIFMLARTATLTRKPIAVGSSTRMAGGTR